MRLLAASTTLLAAAVFVLGIAGCGGDDDDDEGSSGPAATSAAATRSASPPAESGATFVEVDAADFSFDPDALNVAADVELSFAISNTGAAAHTFTVYADESYSEPVEGADTGQIPDLTVGDFTVTLGAGEYYFRCENHPDQMQGTITAE